MKLLGQGISYQLTERERKLINDLLTFHKFSPLTTDYVKEHMKALINGKVFSSKENKRAKRSNDYTVSYIDSNGLQSYALVNKYIYISIQNISLAFITELSITVGPSYEFTSHITTQSKNMLFSDYQYYKKGCMRYIFTHQIKEKCINLSFAGKTYKSFTLPVNNIEVE